MQNRHVISIFFASLALAFGGCGRNREQAERDKQRLQAEEQAQREIWKSNQAVNEVSKKLGRKPPTMDIGVPVPTQPQPAPATPPPAPKP
jgi:hypothetical protein